MPELDLPRGPRELFAAVRKPLAQAFAAEENIRFGGGTALAARWAHRHSVDVDLFVDRGRYDRFYRHTSGRFTLDLAASHPVAHVELGRRETQITFEGRDGHVSVLPSQGLPHHDPRSPDTPRGSRMPFETTAEILSKKLLYRMADRQIIVSQDLYDLAFAQRRDPHSLRTALSEPRPEELRRVLVAFDDHAASGRGFTPLIDPSDPQLERDAAAIVRQLIERESRYRPHPGSERGPAFEPSR